MQGGALRSAGKGIHKGAVKCPEAGETHPSVTRVVGTEQGDLVSGSGHLKR